MKDILNYYYDINVNKLEKKDDNFLVYTEDGMFLCSKLFDDIYKMELIINYLNSTNVPYHLLVLTKEGNTFIEYENSKYVLFKCRGEEITNPLLFNSFYLNGSNDWGKLWSERIDYYEVQLNELPADNYLRYAINYYIGLTENAIALFNDINKKNIKTSICHNKMRCPLDIIDFYSPSNLTVDYYIRDIAEYIKYSFFEECLSNNDILKLIDSFNFDIDSACLFLDRLLYPSYFFEEFDKYMVDRDNNSLVKMNLYMKKSLEYENLLKIIYSKLSNNYRLNIYMWIFISQH